MAHEQGLRVSCQTAKFMENQLKQLSGPSKNRLRRIKPAALRAALYSWFCTMSASFDQQFLEHDSEARPSATGARSRSYT